MINEQGRKSMDLVRKWVRAELRLAVVDMMNTPITDVLEAIAINQEAEARFEEVLQLMEEDE